MIFANPAILWGLLAIAIPIAIHLFNFRRYRKVYFSNVDRLTALRTESRRNSTLRRWLVLLLRCLAVVFLVLAFAQPSLPGDGHTLRSGATVVSVYIDNSFSMENSGSDGSQLEAAKQKAREIAAAYRHGDRYQLLSNNLGGEEFRWLSREEFLDAVDALDISPASRCISEVAARQGDFMRQSGAANRHAYLVSDFQTSNADLNRLSTLNQLSTINSTLVPLEGIPSDNLYIDTLRLDAPAYFIGSSVTIEATVRNGGSHDVEKLPVRLFIGGRERALATLDIPASASAKASLHFTLDSAGWLDGHVEITDYPITFDDHYHFTLLAGERIEMLQVGKDNDNLKKLFADDSALRYQHLSSLPPQLSTLNFILLNEVSDLPSGQAQTLAAWVEQGGTLAVIPPPDAKIENLNALLAQLQAPRLDRWMKRSVKATAIDFQSSLYRGVFNGTSNEMEMPTVQGHYSLSSSNAVMQNIITLADGTTLLATAPHGNGRLYLFSSPLTPEWTTLTAQALFVPTLYNMALYSRPQPEVCHTLGDPSPIFLQRTYDPAATPPQLTQTTQSGNNAILPNLRRIGLRSVLLLHGELSADGIYRLGDDELLAFNYPRQESQLEFLSRNDIEEMIDDCPNVSLVRNAAKPLDQEIRARENGTPLWRWCLLLALAALAGETVLLLSKARKVH